MRLHLITVTGQGMDRQLRERPAARAFRQVTRVQHEAPLDVAREGLELRRRDEDVRLERQLPLAVLP